MDKDATEEADKELRRASPEQLFQEVFDQRVKMEDNEKEKAGKGGKAKQWEI